jgi:hypothetical protein
MVSWRLTGPAVDRQAFHHLAHARDRAERGYKMRKSKLNAEVPAPATDPGIAWSKR